MNDGLDSLAPAMMPLCPRSHPHRSHAYMQLRPIQGCQPTHDYLQCGGGPRTTFPRMYKYIPLYTCGSRFAEFLIDQILKVTDYPLKSLVKKGPPLSSIILGNYQQKNYPVYWHFDDQNKLVLPKSSLLST